MASVDGLPCQLDTPTLSPAGLSGHTSGSALDERTFDFRRGTSRWGHALHAGTWHEVEPRTVTSGHLWWRRETPVAGRASVMVHATPSPRVGDRLLMSGASGADWDLLIVDVRPCWDPRDMFTLTLEFDQDPIAKATSSPAQVPGDSLHEPNTELPAEESGLTVFPHDNSASAAARREPTEDNPANCPSCRGAGYVVRPDAGLDEAGDPLPDECPTCCLTALQAQAPDTQHGSQS